MKALFADSFYFLALANFKDSRHARAVTYSENRVCGLVTTAWVLTEVGNFLSAVPQRRIFIELLTALKSNPLCTVVPAAPELFERGVDLYSRRMDKEWSLTDCISFVVMEDYGLTVALTGDHHFQQAGFKILLSD